MGFDRDEAGAVAQHRLEELRQLSFDELRNLPKERVERVGPSGVRYQLVVQTLWDDRTNRHLRVIVLVDDGSQSAYAPLSTDFIITDGGTYVDESAP